MRHTASTAGILLAFGLALALPTPARASSLVGAWMVGQGAGSTILDATGGGRDGVFSTDSFFPSDTTLQIFASEAPPAWSGPSPVWVAGPTVATPALFFGGPGSPYVRIPDPSGALDPAAGFTVSFWVNGPSSQAGGDGGFFDIIDHSHHSIETPPEYTGWTLQGQGGSGSFDFAVGTGGGFNAIPVSGALDGTWHHVVLAASPAAGLSATIDGVLVSQLAGPIVIDPEGVTHNDPDGFSLNLGDSFFAPQRGFVGALADVEVSSNAVPEPASLGLAALALGGALAARRRRGVRR